MLESNPTVYDVPITARTLGTDSGLLNITGNQAVLECFPCCSALSQSNAIPRLFLHAKDNLLTFWL